MNSAKFWARVKIGGPDECWPWALSHGSRGYGRVARRQHIHGPLMPMARPGKDNGTGFDHLPIWDEQPRIGRAFLAIATLIAAVGGLVVAFGGN